MQRASSSSLSAGSAATDEHQEMPPSCAAGDLDADDYPFFEDIVIPPDLLFPDLDDDGYVDDQAAMGQQPPPQPAAAAQAQQGDEEQIAISYHGQMLVFDSVEPKKIENILLLLNGQEIPSQSMRPHITNLVKPIVIPHNFDRSAALMRYRMKKKRNIKYITKADYSVRREVALRMKRRKGKFIPTVKNPEDSLAAGVHNQGNTSDITFCTNCGLSSDATPMMRCGPNGTKTFCNACGLMWANTGKLRKPKGPTYGGQRDW